ncbi:uncharacterized protein L969DRAFT_96148 [Mixia osmundae IAM 14324]|uniref:MoaB/Mog domain-containing protein n=1 Tax=Mixia osmundae (strain CBS 9802 / IAM 14324 / JCM 22182 / KY 12970) TaxID=764103 RepID=G7EA64_MIXOS|nr:uncharacterized protein L969DRAFT_96148 [Mixia osmundae IAM 14324]KEI37622.1 hypothetical protein L969DRAFT_96148 [Mixia osmundae IAM 14324]GAA99724.1 hypothetical protein E5Q_06427 [Mixia osmundae IAM 14324]
MLSTCAVITVSDTAARDASTDATGPMLLNELQSAGYSLPSRAHYIVPDELSAIRDAVRCAAVSSRLVVTTGGTGFGLRDVTPEAVGPLIVKHAPGLVHLMMSTSLAVTPMAALSRPVCGVTQEGALVVTLPGSPKGARENLMALLKVLPHALELISGSTGEDTHRAMGAPERAPNMTDSAHICVHRQRDEPRSLQEHAALRSFDPTQGVARRYRRSPYPIIQMSEALDLILQYATVGDVERVDLSAIVGRVLAETVMSHVDLPSVPTTNVDGYAIFSDDSQPRRRLMSADQYQDCQELEKWAVRVATGGPVPARANAIIMVEDTTVSETGQTGEEITIDIHAIAKIGEHFRQIGSDVRAGDTILRQRDLISPVGGEVASLAFIGRHSVLTYRKPVVAVMSTGNELQELVQTTTPQVTAAGVPIVFDSNRPSLLAALKAQGFDAIDLGIIGDDVSKIKQALELGLSRADVIVTTGGTSMGESDYLKTVIERELHGTCHFGRVAMKPGKPTTFATLPGQRPTLVFALPGNPASALVTFYVFVMPALRKVSGYRASEWHLPRVRVQITSDFPLDPRPEFHRVSIVTSQEAPYLRAFSTGGQRSSRTISMAAANGLVALPSSKDAPVAVLKAGSLCDAILIGPPLTSTRD